MGYINVRIDEDTALQMLNERVKFWTDDEVKARLFETMYQYRLESGYFDGGEFDVMCIVDNDYINNCIVLYPDEPDYKKARKVYDEQGLGDCSCEDCVGNYIEAYDEDSEALLISY